MITNNNICKALCFCLHLIVIINQYASIYTLGTKCNKLVRRKEIRELSEEELNNFLDAVLYINNLNSNNSMLNTKPSLFDELSNIHITNAVNVHGTSTFLPWHREYIYRFEQLLQTYYSKDIVLPYWDWTLDYKDPANSVVMKILGENGDRQNDNCVTRGKFSNFMLHYPTPHCLRRDYDYETKLSPFYSKRVIEKIKLDNRFNFNSFSSSIEALPHAIVHTNIGTLFGDMNYLYSSNDIVFYLHHAFIDLVYYEWQQSLIKDILNKNKNSNLGLSEMYKLLFNGVDNYGNNISANDYLNNPFDSIKIMHTLDPSNTRYCYYYDNSYAHAQLSKKDNHYIPKSKTSLFTNSTSVTNSTSSSTDDIDYDEDEITPDARKIPDQWWANNNIDPVEARKLEQKYTQ